MVQTGSRRFRYLMRFMVDRVSLGQNIHQLLRLFPCHYYSTTVPCSFIHLSRILYHLNHRECLANMEVHASRHVCDFVGFCCRLSEFLCVFGLLRSVDWLDTVVSARLSEKKLLNIKRVFWFSLRLLFEIFLILRRIHRDIIINVKISAWYPLFLSDFIETWIFSVELRKIPRYKMSSKSVKWEPSCSMRTEEQTEGRTDGRTDEHDKANTCRNFANAPKKSDPCVMFSRRWYGTWRRVSWLTFKFNVRE
jgi:hypothetical protein